MADPHTFSVVRLSVATGKLAGPRTDPAQNAGQDIGPPVQFVGPTVTFFIYTADIARDIGSGRTGILAGNTFGYLAEIPGIRRIGDLGYDVCRVDLCLVLVDSLLFGI